MMILVYIVGAYLALWIVHYWNGFSTLNKKPLTGTPHSIMFTFHLGNPRYTGKHLKPN